MKLICVGDNVTDYYPEVNMLYPGGSAYNVAVLARRYGLETAYIGTFGDDNAGRYQIEVLKEEDVNISHIDVKEGKNAVSKIINRDGLSKVIDVDKGVYRQFSLNKKQLKYIGKYDYLHTTIYSYTEKYLAKIKDLGVTVSFDYSFKSTDKYLSNTAPWVDIAFFSGINIQTDIKNFIVNVSKMGPDYVIVTMGDNGVHALINGRHYYHPSYPVNVVDTLGAGDAFISMFLRCIIKGLSPLKTLEKSSKTASKSCKRYGSVGRGIKHLT